MKTSQGPTYYIHIGIPKTASTTIQSFLTMHRPTLVQRGVLYPQSIAKIGRNSELHRLLGVAVEPESVPWLAGLRKALGDADVIALLIEETARTACDIVILSSEALAFMRHPKALRRALMPHAVRIVVYLRRQDNFLASFYNQLIKSRLYAATFDEFLRQNADGALDLREFHMSLDLCNYDRLLKRWTEAFGRENVLAGVYEDHTLPAGILQDFASKTGMDIAGLALPGEDTNPALQPTLLSLKRRVNALLSSEEERVFSEKLFISYAEKYDGVAPSRDEVSEDVERRNAILAGYQAGNDSVAQEYFGNRQELFEAPAGQDSLLPDSRKNDYADTCDDVTITIMARLIAEVCR